MRGPDLAGVKANGLLFEPRARHSLLLKEFQGRQHRPQLPLRTISQAPAKALRMTHTNTTYREREKSYADANICLQSKGMCPVDMLETGSRGGDTDNTNLGKSPRGERERKLAPTFL